MLSAAAIDVLLFGTLPYVAFAVFFILTIQRYIERSFTYSSLSSQFLENRQHFWGMVPFHYGILVVLAGHVVGLLIPRTVLAWNSRPLRLYVLEVTALVFGLLTVIGLAALIGRRATNGRLRTVTSAGDWLILALLMAQVGGGVLIAVLYPWGSSWYAALGAPYLWSIVRLHPDVALVAALPWPIKFHIINAFLIVAVFPFTRLVHILVIPNPYLWRKPQVVRWHGPAPAAARNLRSRS
jgi:nitrate reductase gamma subunit